MELIETRWDLLVQLRDMTAGYSEMLEFWPDHERQRQRSVASWCDCVVAHVYEVSTQALPGASPWYQARFRKAVDRLITIFVEAVKMLKPEAGQKLLRRLEGVTGRQLSSRPCQGPTRASLPREACIPTFLANMPLNSLPKGYALV